MYRILGEIEGNPSRLWPGAAVETIPDDEARPTVVVIDDDQDVREALRGLLRSAGLGVELFGSVQEFLDSARPDLPGCLVLDVRLPGRSGLDFHDDLVKAKVRIPVIFISGRANVPMSVRAMKAGAVDFLTKPVRHQDLLDAIHRAIDHDHVRRDEQQVVARLRADIDTLLHQLTGPAIRAGYFTGFAPPQTHGDSAVLKAQEWVHMRDGRDVSLTSMAAAARLERRTFLRRFANATGMTPIEYCRAIRIARARELLEFGNTPQKEIARSLGYKDVGSFARVFRKITGLAPGAHRKKFGLNAVSADDFTRKDARFQSIKTRIQPDSADVRHR